MRSTGCRLEQLREETSLLSIEMASYARSPQTEIQQRALLESVETYACYLAGQRTHSAPIGIGDPGTLSMVIRKVRFIREHMYDMLDYEYELCLLRFNASFNRMLVALLLNQPE